MREEKRENNMDGNNMDGEEEREKRLKRRTTRTVDDSGRSKEYPKRKTGRDKLVRDDRA